MDARTEVIIRMACFAGVLLLMLAWELIAPRRTLSVKRTWRWSSNLGLVVVNNLMVRLVVPLTAVGAAEWTQHSGWGLLNMVGWPTWIAFLIGVLALDLAIYSQHILFHRVPWFWRLHLVHHADMDFDVTTGLRFHTFEILLSALFKLAVVLLLAPPVMAVLVFEVVLNASSMFTHSNIRLPLWLDARLRWLMVTPDMHRVHHSVIPSETNRNFGFNLSWWDYLFRTYQSQPVGGHCEMGIGLQELRDERQTERLPGMLMLPFAARRRP